MKKILIAIYTLFLLFLVGSAIFASKTFDGDVDNAYEKGMQYPVELEKIKKLGWHFSTPKNKIIMGLPGNIELLISDNDKKPVSGAQVSMELSLLTKPDTLPIKRAKESSPGSYIVSASLPYHGHWQVDAIILYNGEKILHRFKIYIEENNKQ
jgi:hypothetical protein